MEGDRRLADIVNLRMARKARKRSEEARMAEQNRASFGRTKGERQAQEHELRRQDAALDGARRETD
jgi:hypothetical protein